MPGFDNAVVYGTNIDLSGGSPVSGQFATNGQLLIGTTAVNAGGTHINIGVISSTNSTITVGYSSPNITLDINSSVVGQTITGTSGGALSPTAGNWNILGASTAAGTSPVSTAGAVSTLTINVQKSQAIASTDATKVGLANFNSSYFSVDANGFVSLTGTSSLLWSVITADQTAVVNNGYICNKASALVLTLPATAAIGDVIRVTGINTALGWKIAQNANQQIFFGNTQTTLGATGYLQSSAIRDSVEIVCVVAGASTVYNVISSVGNITVN